MGNAAEGRRLPGGLLGLLPLLDSSRPDARLRALDAATALLRSHGLTWAALVAGAGANAAAAPAGPSPRSWEALAEPGPQTASRY